MVLRTGGGNGGDRGYGEWWGRVRGKGGVVAVEVARVSDQ